MIAVMMHLRKYLYSMGLRKKDNMINLIKINRKNWLCWLIKDNLLLLRILFIIRCWEKGRLVKFS